jgi:hypothetical protein
MRRVLSVVAAAILIGLVGLTPAYAAPANWGQEVKACNSSDCYPLDTSRGGYVRVQAADEQGPGYAWEIHNLAHPGNSH